MTELRASRLAEVDGALDRAAAAVGAERPEHAGPVRGALDGLRARLHRFHDLCHQAGDDTWSAYVAGLDHGLDQLQAEIARTSDRPEPGPSLDELLYRHTTGLELAGWRLRFTILADRGEHPAEAAAAEQAARQLADPGGGAPARAEVERTMETLRASP